MAEQKELEALRERLAIVDDANADLRAEVELLTEKANRYANAKNEARRRIADLEAEVERLQGIIRTYECTPAKKRIAELEGLLRKSLLLSAKKEDKLENRIAELEAALEKIADGCTDEVLVARAALGGEK